jgi:hypothetical protein
MHALMARADAESAAQRSGFSTEQRAELHTRITANAAAGRPPLDGLDADELRVAELGDSEHYTADAASSRSRRAQQMRDEFDRVFWGVEP